MSAHAASLALSGGKSKEEGKVEWKYLVCGAARRQGDQGVLGPKSSSKEFHLSQEWAHLGIPATLSNSLGTAGSGRGLVKMQRWVTVRKKQFSYLLSLKIQIFYMRDHVKSKMIKKCTNDQRK